MEIKILKDWVPKFSPQVTLQHPLEFTIPLYFNLLGFDNPSFTIPFSASLPGMDYMKEALREGNSEMYQKIITGYQQKIAGLIFLHAFTLIRMTPLEKQSDEIILNEILNQLEKTHQVDIKSALSSMSRRPFSEMLLDIKLPKEVYVNSFNTMMRANESCMFWDIQKNIERTNYAEQFFDQRTGKPLDLKFLIPFLDDSFYLVNKEIIDEILRKGVLSMLMIRNFRDTVTCVNIGTSHIAKIKEIFRDYFRKSLLSLGNRSYRYFLDPNTAEIKCEPFVYDLFSPPYFLDLENSMGRYKHAILEKEKYGEAIVEIRGIKDVAKRILKKINKERNFGHFLVYPQNIKQEALFLFNFLSEFCEKNIDDFSVGIAYTVSDRSLH